MATSPITTRLDKASMEKLEKLSTATKRSKSFIVAEAVALYLSEQEWQIEAIMDGLDQAERGVFAADSEVRKLFKKRGVIES